MKFLAFSELISLFFEVFFLIYRLDQLFISSEILAKEDMFVKHFCTCSMKAWAIILITHQAKYHTNVKTMEEK